MMPYAINYSTDGTWGHGGEQCVWQKVQDIAKEEEEQVTKMAAKMVDKNAT